ncbi:ketosteroid isomerase-related protein [Chelativorans salis]|uniref:Nuclear transport factor 2 family protein n=1 Tax=Chelativorans salis TaxID=2978478 RepID=A0ABT2LK00_9HYPH|nr:ketosteroid isomerase-related protein [Chelativorans sp. EGI FJ00035]MCT7374932.1 nuclear transport factor 2 family protein [Chelativorans sp. EGI FJ00035]
MNEADTRALVERYLTAFNASDHEAMLACLSEDVVHDTREGERQIGKEKFRWWLAENARHFREELADIIIMTAPGGVRAAAEFTVRGTYLATAEGQPEARDQSYRLQAGIFFDVDDDLVTRLTDCFNRAALKAQLEKG